MALPTLNVTPGTGATINTLPNAPTTTANSVSVALATDQAAVPISAVSLPLPAGAATAAGVAAVTAALGSISAASNASGGVSTYAALGGTGNALLTNSLVAVKAAAANLYGVSFVNTGSVTTFVQIFDALATGVTLGTTAPKLSFWIPPGGAWEEKFVDEVKVSFVTGITIAATTTPTGGAAPVVGIMAHLYFK